AGDSGSHTFSGVTFLATGSRTITATDTVTGSITGSASVTVSPGPATHFNVTGPVSATAGSSFSVTVQAKDAGNNNTTNYSGTVHFATSDAATGVALRANYTFQLADNGQKIFTNGVTLQTAGPQSITATDAGNGTINASAPITVTNDAAITPTPNQTPNRTIR